MNDNDDLTRPSTLLAAVGLGLVVGGALLLADLTRGQLRDMAIYPVAAIVAVGFVLGAWHGGLGLLGFVLLVWDAYTVRKPEQAVAGGAEVAEPERMPSPLVGGYLLNEWEQYHRDGLRLLFQHGRAAGALTSTALIGAAFRDSAHWGYWTDLAAANRLCEKQNGVTTALPPNRTFTWALRRVEVWDCDAPEGTTPLPLPYPFPATSAYRVKLDKATLGGTRRDEDD